MSATRAMTTLLLLLTAVPAVAQNAGAYRPGQSWPRVQFPDGTGSIALPPGGW